MFDINDNSIEATINSILDLTNEIEDKFNEMNELTGNLSNFFKGDYSNIFIDNYNLIVPKFLIVKNKLLNYSTKLKQITEQK